MLSEIFDEPLFTSFPSTMAAWGVVEGPGAGGLPIALLLSGHAALECFLIAVSQSVLLAGVQYLINDHIMHDYSTPSKHS